MDSEQEDLLVAQLFSVLENIDRYITEYDQMMQIGLPPQRRTEAPPLDSSVGGNIESHDGAPVAANEVVHLDSEEQVANPPAPPPTDQQQQNIKEDSRLMPGLANDSSQKAATSTTTALVCPICMESSIQRTPESTICGHIFCSACIQVAILERNQCPICNKELERQDIHRLYLN